jgi:hypothetical protein
MRLSLFALTDGIELLKLRSGPSQDTWRANLWPRNGAVMPLILIIIVIVLLFGGGGYYYGRGQAGAHRTTAAGCLA